MYANANDGPKIPDSERDAFRHALDLYYTQGPPITAVFDEVEAGLVDRYYRRKNKYPDEIAQIDQEARELAANKRSSIQTASDAQLMHASFALQHRAAEALRDVLEELFKIALRQPMHVVVGRTRMAATR